MYHVTKWDIIIKNLHFAVCFAFFYATQNKFKRKRIVEIRINFRIRGHDEFNDIYFEFAIFSSINYTLHAYKYNLLSDHSDH